MRRTLIAIVAAIPLGIAASASASPAFGPPIDVKLPVVASAVSFSVTVADVNGDGRQDLITPVTMINSKAPPGVFVVLAKGGGGYGAPIFTAVTIPPFWSLAQVAAADFNGDGKLDLAVPASPAQPGQLTVEIGDGTGHFTPGVTVPVPNSAEYSAAADLNGDGKADLVVSGVAPAGAPALAVYLGDGAGGLALAPKQPPPAHGANDLLLRDMDGDGGLDIVSSGFGGEIDVFHGNGDATFAAPAVSTTPPGAQRDATADFNGDGRLDVAQTNIFGPAPGTKPPYGYGSPGTAYLALAGPGGALGPGQLVGAVGVLPSAIAGADLTGDGKPDLIVGNLRATFTAVGQFAGAVSIFDGNGDGTFGVPADYGNHAVRDVVAQDVNGDGHPDVVEDVAGVGVTIEVLPGLAGKADPLQQMLAAIPASVAATPAPSGPAITVRLPIRLPSSVSVVTVGLIAASGASGTVGHGRATVAAAGAPALEGTATVRRAKHGRTIARVALTPAARRALKASHSLQVVVAGAATPRHGVREVHRKVITLRG